LISSGLLFNSFVRVLLDDRGFDPNGVVMLQYRIPIGEYLRGSGSFHGFPSMLVEPPVSAIERVHERLKALPGVEAVAGSSAPPVNGIVPPTATLKMEDRSVTNVIDLFVTDNFFQTMKTPLLRGRNFDTGDTALAPWVAIINETLAQQAWPGEDPVGKRFTIDAASGEQPREVIGVVRDVSTQYIRTPDSRKPMVYTPYLQHAERYDGWNGNAFGQMTFFVRTDKDLSRIASAARGAVAEIDPRHPLANVVPLTEYVGNRVDTLQRYVSTLGAFAFMATLLAAVGVYGVMSSAVSQRTREIGIRVAMGATRRDVVKLVGERALRAIALGLIFGILGSLVLTRGIQAQLWGVTRTDLPTFAAVTVFLVIVSLAACLVPARRAMRVQPSEALRID
jgi:putative ABC transport system permease protein